MIWGKVEVALDAWLEEVDDFGVDGAKLSVESDAGTLEVWNSGSDVLTADSRRLVEASDVWLSKLVDFDVLDMEGIELVVEPSSWLAEVNDSDFVVSDEMTPVAGTSDRLKKVNGVTLAGIATLVAAPGV